MAETLPFTFTGADLYALCSDAMLKAVTRSARAVDQRVAAINADRASRGQSKVSVAYYFDHYGTDQDSEVTVVEEDFMRAREELTPSVSLDELRHYERVRSTFEGTTKKDDASAEPGTLANPSQNGQSIRSRAMDAMKRGSKNKLPTINWGPHPTPRADTGEAAADEAEDDYVIRTDKLTLNDHASKAYVGKGKGKGKIQESGYSPVVGERLSDGVNPTNNGDVMQPDGDVEDLYD